MEQLAWHPSYKQNSNLKTVVCAHITDAEKTLTEYAELASRLPRDFPYLVKPFDYSQPNEYNKWNDFTAGMFGMGINPYFPFPTPLYLQYGYVIRISGLYNGISISNPWAYNNWDTFLHDIYHKVGCTMMFSFGYTRDTVTKCFQSNPMPAVNQLSQIGPLGTGQFRTIWEYTGDAHKITVDIFSYTERDQLGNPLVRF
jgi:hypothetical protein